MGAMYLWSKQTKRVERETGKTTNGLAFEGQHDQISKRKTQSINSVKTFPLGRGEQGFVLADIKDPSERRRLILGLGKYLDDTEGGIAGGDSWRLIGDRVKGPETGHIFLDPARVEKARRNFDVNSEPIVS